MGPFTSFGVTCRVLEANSPRDARPPYVLIVVTRHSCPPPTCQPLRIRVRTGAEALCREWYEAHGAAVYNYFRFHVPLPDVAEDLTAETFLKVVRAVDRSIRPGARRRPGS